MPKPLLEVSNLVTTFENDNGAFRAVDGVSFQLSAGETLGIVGESGSGKSVTSLSLMRLIQAPAGKIAEGKAIFHVSEEKTVDLFQLSDAEMRTYRGNEIAMIFQEPMTSLNPVFTCGEQVAEALRLHKKLSRKEAKLRTIELFNKVKLPRAEQMYDSYPHQLSGGQKQRIMIAMAISCDPKILIADEPTTALDVSVQATILELLQEIQKENGMGMIFITHDLGVISKIAQKVLVMFKGKVVESGNVIDLFTNAKHPYTKGLLACRPASNLNLKRLPVISDFMRIEQDGSIVETGKGINDIVRELSKVDDRKQRLEKLYAQEPVLKINQLQTYFPIKSSNWFKKSKEFVKAVDDITFDVYPGETLGLVGESGCGKTTLGRSILRLIEPTNGSIHYKGKDFRALDTDGLRAMRKQMQLIFQDPYSSLNPRMTIGNAIMEPMEVHGLYENKSNRKAKTIELLKKVGLNETHFNRYPHQFSGGQRQRVCIARALSLNPDFIICDESVSALDVSVQAQVLNLLNELKEEQGLTYIFISHDLSVVRFMSDRMLVMNKGCIEELGDSEEVYNNPKSAYTKKLIAAIPK
jgi:peptide/nickel transport system ATP-binding protein